MSRRTTRPARLAVLLAAPVLLLGACGNDTGTEGAAGRGLSAVTISGEFGQEPEVTWEDQLVADELESEVLISGDGPGLEDGQHVFTRLWLGNGFTKSEAYSTFGEDAPPDLLKVGGDLSPAFAKALDGQTVGSRVAVAAPPKDAFGEAGNSQLGIGNADSVLFVIDIISLVPNGPSGTEDKPAAWAPAIEGDDDPTGLDFARTPEPNGKLRLTTLIQGDGAPTEKGQTVAVDYLGQVYDGKEPFDGSYERAEPFSFSLGAGNVIKGWDTLLEGVPVGSRVLIAVPPDQGYGEAGSPDAGIKGDDTLYFVIDVLAAL